MLHYSREPRGEGENGNNKLGVTEGCVEDVPDLGACVVAYALGRLPEYPG